MSVCPRAGAALDARTGNEKTSFSKFVIEKVNKNLMIGSPLTSGPETTIAEPPGPVVKAP